MQTTKVSDYISRRRDSDKKFDAAFKEENKHLEVAKALRGLRESEGLTQDN